MQSSKLAIISVIVLISLGSLGYVYAAPSANLTLASGQTTPAQTYKDNSGVTLWQYITSPIATLLSKFIIIYPTNLTHIRGYQFPDANTTVLGNNITQTVSGSNNFTNSWLNFFNKPTILTPHRIIFPTNGSGTVCLRNQTGACGTSVGGGITSINGNGTAAQLITANSIQGNLTIKDSGNTHQIGLGQSVAVLNTTQTFTGAKAFKGPANHNVLNFTDSTGKLVSSISQTGLYNGPISIQNGPDYTIYVNNTDGLYYLSSGKNGTILAKSQNSSDASVIIQKAINFVNMTVGPNVNSGGWIDNDCGNYKMHGELELPRRGNMTFTGHGVGCTIFQMEAGKNLNFMAYRGTGVPTSFFNHFAHFHVFGGIAAGDTNTTGFFMDSKGSGGSYSGISDSTFDDLFLLDFKRSAIFLNDQQCWNVIISNSLIEHSSNAGLEINGSGNGRCSDIRVVNNKFIVNEGSGINETGALGQYIGNWIYLNNKYGIIDNALYGGTTYGTYNTFIGNNFQNNGHGTNNLYDDIKLLGVGAVVQGNNFYGTENGQPNKVRYNVNIATFTLNNLVSGNNCVGNNIGTAKFFNGVTSSTNYVGYNNGCGAWNGFGDIHDATKIAAFYGMGNFPTQHTFNFTMPNRNGTVGLVGSYNSTTATNKTGTSSTSQVMYGSPLVTTLNGTGKTVINVNGETQDSALSGGCRVELRYSTSYMGGNGVAATGTQVGSNIDTNTASANQVTRFTDSWTVQLTKNTKYYFDVSFANNGAAGTCTLSDVDWNVYELQ